MSHTSQVYETDFFGETAVCLKADRYEACVLPRIGGNLISFRQTDRNLHFLREPKNEAEMKTFLQNPTIWGIPVLFPPNRYEDGLFRWNGNVYRFPINEEDKNNHLHGFVHSIPWQVDSMSAENGESQVTLCLNVDESHSVYTFLPHAFTMRIRYTLSERGLLQHVFVQNNGQNPLPCLLAFHTTLNAPFDSESKASDYVFKATIGKRWEVSERMLPTGSEQPLSKDEEKIRHDGINPFFEEMDNHYSAAPVNGSNRMELTDTRTGMKLIYDAGTSYKHWMIWNNGATEGFFCPEPQINRINAPNIKQPDEEVGLV